MSLEEDEISIMSQNWRKALRTAPSYRVGNRTLHLQTKFISLIILTGLIFLFFMYILPSFKRDLAVNQNVIMRHKHIYNNTYPLSPVFDSKNLVTFRIGLIADLDTNSKSKTEPHTWYSYYKKGFLTYNKADKKILISWDKGNDIKLTSHFSAKGRGMELSELVVFNGRLLTFDDRSGIVYEILNNKAVPWILLSDGDGSVSKGFKSEWATVKDEILYIGSMGKEWTTDFGEFENYNPQYIKMVSLTGEVNHVNWVEQYKTIRRIINIEYPGYMIHESGVWSQIHSKWFFLPRRCSKDKYNDTLDELRGCNILITADEHFRNVQYIPVGEKKPTHGFSSFKFLPNTHDNVIVALKTEEYRGSTTTYITAFTITGEQVLPDVLVANDIKYEGIEFI